MVNFNGNLISLGNNFLSHENRGFKYGDALFETVRISNGKLLFWEDHYFRLMSSMRILRIEIPMNFTMEFLEEQFLITLNASEFNKTADKAVDIEFRPIGDSTFSKKISKNKDWNI